MCMYMYARYEFCFKRVSKFLLSYSFLMINWETVLLCADDHCTLNLLCNGSLVNHYCLLHHKHGLFLLLTASFKGHHSGPSSSISPDHGDAPLSHQPWCIKVFSAKMTFGTPQGSVLGSLLLQCMFYLGFSFVGIMWISVFTQMILGSVYFNPTDPQQLN